MKACIFRSKSATDSKAKRPPIPREGGRGIEAKNSEQKSDPRSRSRRWLINDEEGFLQVTVFSNLQIDDYINGEEIKYLSIPLVESHMENDFLSGMKFTNNDIDEVIEKIDRDLTWISVIVTKDYQSNLSDETIDRGDFIFDKLGFEELEEIGHSESCKTKTFAKTITLFEGRKNDLYLPFDKMKRDIGFWHFLDKKRKELFMRSVLLTRQFNREKTIKHMQSLGV